VVLVEWEVGAFWFTEWPPISKLSVRDVVSDLGVAQHLQWNTNGRYGRWRQRPERTTLSEPELDRVRNGDVRHQRLDLVVLASSTRLLNSRAMTQFHCVVNGKSRHHGVESVLGWAKKKQSFLRAASERRSSGVARNIP
jgi:hypothetical protein